MLPLCWALNIEFVPKRYRASVITIIMVGFSLGGAVAGPLTVWMAPHYGWASVFALGGIATLLSSVLLFFTLPESVRFLVSKQRRPETVARILKRLDPGRSEEHTSELQSLMSISYAVFCLKKKTQ